MSQILRETEVLKIEVKENVAWIGGQWDMPNASKGYHGLLKTWLIIFGLKGKGLLVGERAEAVKSVFQKAFPEAKFQTADYSDLTGNIEQEAPDIHWNICSQKHTKDLNMKVNFVICQSVLEHVLDPYGAVFNMLSVLKKGGRLFIHTVSPKFQQHRFPIDCYRFFRDIWIEYATEFEVDIDDLLWLDHHCFVVYRKRRKWNSFRFY